MDAITIAKEKQKDGTSNFTVADKTGKTIRVIEDIKEILLYVNKVYVGIIDNLTTADYIEYGKVSEEEALNEVLSGISQGDVKVFVRSFFKEEEQLMDVILDNAELITCFNCGGKITDVAPRDGNVAVLNIDPGESNYPHSPDEPASAAFTCIKCIDEPSAEEMAKAERRAMGLSGCQ